jgi:hypothetical protein
VYLSDVDADVVAAWRALLDHEPRDLLMLPQSIDAAPDWAKSLIGFWLANGRATPATRQSSWMLSGQRPNAYWGPVARQDLAVTCHKLHECVFWGILNHSWDKWPVDGWKKPATWFVDPPYSSRGGKSYKHHDVDYAKLATWCKNLVGHGHQVIVCEELGADWLPFKLLGSFRRTPGRATPHTTEVIWTNE